MGELDPDARARQLQHEHNDKVMSRARVLSVLDDMGITPGPRLMIAGGGGTSTQTTTITRPLQLPADSPEMVGIAGEFGEAVPSLIPCDTTPYT